jgi:hypothetical protein
LEAILGIGFRVRLVAIDGAHDGYSKRILSQHGKCVQQMRIPKSSLGITTVAGLEYLAIHNRLT